jgi:hypothetical protein
MQDTYFYPIPWAVCVNSIAMCQLQVLVHLCTQCTVLRQYLIQFVQNEVTVKSFYLLYLQFTFSMELSVVIVLYTIMFFSDCFYQY